MTKTYSNIEETPPIELRLDIESLFTYSEEEPTREKWRQLQSILGTIQEEFERLRKIIHDIGGVVWTRQKLTIAATDLTTTEEANDTLITSGSPLPFRWDDPRIDKCRSMNVEPATGVFPWPHVWDRKAHIAPSIQPVVDPATGNVTHRKAEDCVTQVYAQPTYIQRLQWQDVGGVWKLYAKAWEVGQKVEIVQAIVVGADVLEP